MSTTEQRLAANRINALNSTGPVSPEGKAVVSQNATRHGILSGKLLLDDEHPADFKTVLDGLLCSLNPVGAMEEVLVERIAVTLWRQRRLVCAETASLTLVRQPKKIAAGVSSELGRGYGSELKQEELAPFDAELVQWCHGVLAEIDALGDIEIDIALLEERAPLTFHQLVTDAEDEEGGVAAFAMKQDRGVAGYLGELLSWCREQVRQADARPHVLALAEQVRTKRQVLPADMLELLARYQTTLDNQLFKLLRALREAQEWRLKTLEAGPAPLTDEAQVAEAAT